MCALCRQQGRWKSVICCLLNGCHVTVSNMAPGFNIRQERRVGVSGVCTIQATEVEIDRLLNGCHITDSDVAPGFNIRQRRVGVSGMHTVQATGRPIVVL